MRLSQWIQIFTQVMETEGDLEVEGPDGVLLRNLQIVTRTKRRIAEDRERQTEIPPNPAGGKEK
jgi:hypothetical protein